MEESQFELDPRGDTILILRNPKTEQLLWEPKDDGAKLKQRSNILRQKLFGSELMPDDEKTHKPAAWPFSVIKPNVPSDSEKAQKENSEGNEVLFRLSSRHLALASPVFQTMLNGSWKESAPSSDQSNGSGKPWAPLQNGPDCPVRYELTATEWDTKVFLLFMNMIHCRNKLVPLSIDLTTLVKMAILVDYYQCEEATQLAAGLWIGNLSGKLPTSYGRDCVAWMFVSWVFSRSDIFEKMTKLAIRGSTGGLGTIHLPFPPKLLTAMEQKREHVVDELFTAVGQLGKQLCKGTVGCDPQCRYMLLGSLMTGMYENELYGDCSVDQALSVISSLKSSNIERGYYGHAQSCSLQRLLAPTVERLKSHPGGLKLDDHKDKSKVS